MEEIKINAKFYNFVEDCLTSEEKTEEIFLHCLDKEGSNIGLRANDTYYIFFRDAANLYIRVFVTEKLAETKQVPVRSWIRYGICEFSKENVKKAVEIICTPLPF